MANILTTFKKALINQMKSSISANTARYYAFAANPVPNSDGNVPTLDKNDHDNIFESTWRLLFGKKLTSDNIISMTRKIVWESNTVYTEYDNLNNNLANSNFFVMVPSDPGQYKHVYKVLNNANGVPSTVVPDLQQTTPFTKSDGYTWKYMYSISDSVYSTFLHNDYIPLTPNSTISTAAYNNTGIDRIEVINGGSGYDCYHNGTIRAVVNSTLVQIEDLASGDNSFYTNNSIYIFNNASPTAQLHIINDYVSNVSGKWVYLETSANVATITPAVTQYKISPRVLFDTDATMAPHAYTTINTSANSIESVVIVDAGLGITRASATIVSNTVFGSGANIQCVVPPPGGHGFDAEAELGIDCVGISFTFDGSELSTIPTNIGYNRIGILVDPYALTIPGATKGSVISDSTFNQLFIANVSDSTVFTNNDIVIGQTSGAKGIVAFSNSTQVYIIGDKTFVNTETIISTTSLENTTININKYPDIYAKDLYPIYTQNINDVERETNQTELFKILIPIATE